MNKNQKAWVEALRSGEFKQAQRALQYKDSYCCLGVACVLAEREGIEVLRSEFDNNGLLGTTLSSQPHVVEWLGLESPNGDLCDEAMPVTLAGLNDDGNDFNVIANLIEENADVLFVEEG